MKHSEAVYREVLSERELREMRRLERAGLARGIRYKIDPGVRGGVLCRRNGAVTGYMTVDHFGGSEVESAAIAGSVSDWDEMSALVIAYALENAAESVLFIVDPNDRMVSGRLEGMGLAPAFSEYRMLLDINAFSPVGAGDISVRQAREEDRAYIAGLDADSFEAAAPTGSELAFSRIIQQDGRPAGKLRTDESGGACGIYGVVVEPALRNRGIGARALSLVISELVTRGERTIYLEVDSENAAALHLYQKLGFKIASTFRYYRHSLA